MQESYSAGENVASYCLKCKLVLDHTVVAMDGEKIAKVKCRTCGGAHKFRNPADAPAARKPRTPKKDASGADVRWETAMTGAAAKAQPYRMDVKYRVGDIVDHARFGKGIVQKLYARKCDVLFQDCVRLMASGN